MSQGKESESPLKSSHLEITFPDGSVDKESGCNAGDTADTDLIPGSGRSPREENANPLQYSCLGNSMDRGVCWAAVNGVANSQT